VALAEAYSGISAPLCPRPPGADTGGGNRGPSQPASVPSHRRCAWP